MGAPARGYSWPPFEPGHTRSMHHGAHSERRVAPLAEAILASARACPDWPAYLEDPSYGPALVAWSRAEAICQLLTDYLSQRDIEAALTETGSESVEEEMATPTRRRRMSATRRTMAALEMLRRFEHVAMHHRDRLGLSPLSRSRIGRDVAVAAKLDLARLWAAEGKEELEGP